MPNAETVVTSETMVLDKEDSIMSCGESVIAPAGQTVVSGGGNHREGFTSAEASLIHAGQTSNQASDNLMASLTGSNTSNIQILEAKFQAERSAKESILATERATNSVRAELAQMVRDEGQRTRDLIRDTQLATVQNTANTAAITAAVVAALGAVGKAG